MCLELKTDVQVTFWEPKIGCHESDDNKWQYIGQYT